MKRFFKWMFLDDSDDWQHDIVLGIFGGVLFFSAGVGFMFLMIGIGSVLDYYFP